MEQKLVAPQLCRPFTEPEALLPSKVLFSRTTRRISLKVNQNFGGTYRLHLQGRTISQAKKKLVWKKVTSRGGVISLKRELFETTVVRTSNLTFITVFTRACLWFLFWDRWLQSIPSHPVPLRHILILSPANTWVFHSVSSLQCLGVNLRIHSSLSYVLHTQPISFI
jgi:hypothetical protein